MESFVKLQFKFKDQGWLWIVDEKENAIDGKGKKTIDELFILSNIIENAIFSPLEIEDMKEYFLKNYFQKENITLDGIEKIRILDLSTYKSYILSWNPHLLNLGINQLYIENIIEHDTDTDLDIKE